MKAILYSLSFAFLIVLYPSHTFAQALCGDFVLIEDFEGEVYEERSPIENCENPFGVDTPVPFTPVLQVHNQNISEGSTAFVLEGEPVVVMGNIPEHEDYLPGHYSLYREEGDDYLFMFEGPINRQPSLTLAPGVYTAIFSRSRIPTEVTIDNNLPKRILQWFLPSVAYAAVYFSPDSAEVVTIKFIVAYAPPEPVGASSILFLPGIMGSHLYEDSGECFGFGEQQRWFSHTDCEQLRLLTNPDGSSINDIYTKFEDEAIADKASKFGITLEELYTNFMAEMNQLEEDQTIKDFTPFPYDWRLRLDQVIRMKKDTDSSKVRYVPGVSLQEGLLYQTLSQMASQSHSGEVTIVSHSNGGLVAKAFMAELAEANDPLEAKIDNLILIGSPQVGTPDAVNGILHGTEIGPGGVVINQDTTRKILNTAPFGHHLLPNQHYFDGEGVSVDTPVINFKEGLATNVWRTQYGESIDSFEELKRFLDDSSGRADPAEDDLKTPEVVDGTLLAYAEEVGDGLASWQPPSTLTVHQLGGSGIWTPSRLEYSSNEYCLRAVPIGFTCDAYTGVLDNELHFVMDGDGTVVLPSALAMSEGVLVNRWWLDVHDYNADAETNKVHKNMLEIPEVADFVSNIAQAKDSSYVYITNTPPPIPQDIRLLFHLHSPLDMYVTSDQGMVSSTTSEIPGAFYRRYGDVQYISLPSVVTNATLHMIGYDAGSYTLYKESWEGETEISSVDFKALPTNSGTVVTLPVSFDEAGVMLVDFDGDGEVDGTVSEGEDIIKVNVEPLPPEEIVKEKNVNSSTRIVRDPVPQVAGISTASEEEQLKRIIELLRKIINLLKTQHNL